MKNDDFNNPIDAWHLAAHAAWRAYQFLSAPALMHFMGRPSRPVPRWLAHKRWLYTASLQRFWLDNLAVALDCIRPAGVLTDPDIDRIATRVFQPSADNMMDHKVGVMNLQGMIDSMLRECDFPTGQLQNGSTGPASRTNHQIQDW